MGHKDPEKRRDYSRKYFKENAERLREASRKYREKNPDKVREYSRKASRKYREKNPDKGRHSQLICRVSKRITELRKQYDKPTATKIALLELEIRRVVRRKIAETRKESKEWLRKLHAARRKKQR